MIKQALTLLGLTLAISTNAAILDLGTITRDTDTGLDWLDLTQTTGRSFNDVSSKFGPGQEFEGFRYATSQEVVTLWGNIGVPSISGNISSNDDDFDALLRGFSLLGNTSSSTYDYEVGSIGMFDRMMFLGTEPYMVYVGVIIQNPLDTFVVSDSVGTYDALISPGDAFTWIGSWLVDDTNSTAVPIPAASWLFLSALLGLVGKRRLAYR